MITPPRDPDSIMSVVSDLKGVIRSLISRYLPRVARIPLHQGMVFEPTWKALPTFKVVQSVLYNRCKLKLEDALRSCFLALPYEIASWTSLVNFVHARGEQWSQGILWPKRTRFALDPKKTLGYRF